MVEKRPTLFRSETQKAPVKLDDLDQLERMLIIHIRSLKYGSLTVEIVNSLPVRSTAVTEVVDYRKIPG